MRVMHGEKMFSRVWTVTGFLKFNPKPFKNETDKSLVGAYGQYLSHLTFL